MKSVEEFEVGDWMDICCWSQAHVQGQSQSEVLGAEKEPWAQCRVSRKEYIIELSSSRSI